MKADELFDLKADPGERTNVSRKNPELVEKFRKQVEAIISKYEKRRAKKELGIQEDFKKRLEALGYIE